MNSLKQKGFKVTYSVELPTDPRYPLQKLGGTTTMIFENELKVNSWLDLIAETSTILEVNVSEVEYTPRNSVVYATTRSFE